VQSTGVFSPDGEYLPFTAAVVTEGRPEDWLNNVEEAMFAATKKNLFRVRTHALRSTRTTHHALQDEGAHNQLNIWQVFHRIRHTVKAARTPRFS
jgi:hypothetical protein